MIKTGYWFSCNVYVSEYVPDNKIIIMNATCRYCIKPFDLFSGDIQKICFSDKNPRNYHIAQSMIIFDLQKG